MGGNPPLGYDVSNRKLVVNPAEAETVRLIFQRYMDLGCARLLCTDLKERGVLSKSRVSGTDAARGGKPIERSAIYCILNNRAYIGETTHKGSSYPGEHEAIVPRELFDLVQQRLAELRPSVTTGTRTMQDALLAGRLFDNTGAAMVSTYTVKGGSHRYRYYVSRPATKGEVSKAAISHISAPPLEGVLSGTLRRVGLLADEPWAAMHRMDVRANDIVIRLKRADALAAWRPNVPGTHSLTDRQILSDRQELLQPGETLKGMEWYRRRTARTLLPGKGGTFGADAKSMAGLWGAGAKPFVVFNSAPTRSWSTLPSQP